MRCEIEHLDLFGGVALGTYEFSRLANVLTVGSRTTRSDAIAQVFSAVSILERACQE